MANARVVRVGLDVKVSLEAEIIVDSIVVLREWRFVVLIDYLTEC